MTEKTDENDVLFIGWDVGGMHGGNNALAAIKLVKNIPLEVPDFPHSIKKQKSAEDLAQLLANKIIELATGHSFVLFAIDAPLSFPSKFLAQMADLDRVQALNYKRQIDNDLAYRESEKYMYEKCGKRAMSTTFDQLTSLAILVLRVIQIIRAKSSAPVHKLPFQNQKLLNGINIFETYPAVLKPDKKGNALNKVHEDFLLFVRQTAIPIREDHEKDAQFCALFAAYQWLFKKKDFTLPQDYKGVPRLDGYIYRPE